jgi:MFS family permease
MDASKSPFGHIARSLSSRNYQLYFSGQLVSLIGTWMQQLALSWLTYRLTSSPLLLGAVAFASTAPSFFLGPFAGVLSDRVNRHKLIVGTQIAAMLLAFTLAALTLFGHIQLWQILVLGILTGLVNAVDMPTRQAFVTDMVLDKKDLPNAIALNSSLMNLTRLIGPAIAGGVISTLGEGVCFLANGLSYIAVIAALLCMRFATKPQVIKKKATVFSHMKEGFVYAFQSGPIKTLLIISAITSLAGMPLSTLMPALVQQTFHGGADVLGWLMSASAIGRWPNILLAEKAGQPLALWCHGTFSSSLMVLPSLLISCRLSSSVDWLWCDVPNVCYQHSFVTLVEEDKRGRVMSIYTMYASGMMPIGSLIVGASATAMVCQLQFC